MNENQLVSLDDAALDEVNGGAWSIGGEIKITLPKVTFPDLGDIAEAGKKIIGAVVGLFPTIG